MQEVGPICDCRESHPPIPQVLGESLYYKAYNLPLHDFAKMWRMTPGASSLNLPPTTLEEFEISPPPFARLSVFTSKHTHYRSRNHQWPTLGTSKKKSCHSSWLGDHLFVPIHFWGCLLSKGNFGRKKKKKNDKFTHPVFGFPIPSHSQAVFPPKKCSSSLSKHFNLSLTTRLGEQKWPASSTCFWSGYHRL